MNPRRAVVIFWIAVVIDVLAVGIGWSAWKATSGASPLPLAIAAPATIVAGAATLVCGRILTVFTRASRHRT